MSFIYKIFLLYPYWFIKTLIHWIFQFYKNIFCLHINENKIDQLSGFEFELLIQKLLIKSGYHSVKITQASGDYGIDLLAKKNQVKDNKKILVSALFNKHMVVFLTIIKIEQSLLPILILQKPLIN